MGQLAKQCLVSIGMTTAKVDRVVTYCSKIKIYDMIIITLITQSNTLQILYNLSLVWYDIITYHKPQLIVTVSSSVVIACLFASNRLFHLTIKSRTWLVVITHSLSLSSSLYSSSSSALGFSTSTWSMIIQNICFCEENFKEVVKMKYSPGWHHHNIHCHHGHHHCHCRNCLQIHCHRHTSLLSHCHHDQKRDISLLY